MTLAVNLAQGASNNVTFRNRIINGAMVLDQRNAGAAITGTTSLLYSVDRFNTLVVTDGVMTFQQVSDAPTGFTYSLKATATTADASLTATQRAILFQRIEGYNVADFMLGSANAVQFTASFWVKSTLTGTFGGSFQNTGSARAYPFTYTISSASTWERKTITITGDTTGTWDTTNGSGLQIVWGLGVGSTFSATAGSWQAGDFNSATGAVSVIGTLNATWQVTGVQLEAGTTASPFEYRQYGTELNLCQRYFQKQIGGGRHFIGGNGGVSGCFPTAYLLQTLRSNPTLSYSAVGDFTVEGITGGGQSTCTSLSLNAYTFNSVTVQAGSASSTGGTGGQLLGNNANVWTAFSAEL